MQGDGFVTLLVCTALLAGVVTGLKFNVRMLVWLCLAAIVAGAVLSTAGVVAGGRGLLSTVVSVVALQVGYFVAVVIGAMRLTEEPIAVTEDVPARKAHPMGSRPKGA